MKEYELYVPLNYNDDSLIEPKKLTRLREKLLLQFGSLTYFPQRSQGFWTYGGVTYRDEIVIYRVVTDRVRAARRFFRQLKAELKHDFRQEEILIVEKDAQVI
ncbi:MAG: hypothetical protein HY000_27060 [Planctomycetes bacterium]|nr:hypothetical protein [Planctomycetota bacterium]